MSLYKGTTLVAGAMPNSANQSLSNLDSAGQDIIDNKIDLDYSNADYQPVNKAGDTMTGDLTIDTNTNTPHILLQSNIFDYTTTVAPANAISVGSIGIRDKNENNVGLLQTMQSTSSAVETRLSVFRNINGTSYSGMFRVEIDSNGVASCNFPNTSRCDGQWQNLNQSVVSVNTSLNGSSNLSYTLNIPNDGHHHMVLLFAEGDTGNASGNLLTIKIGSDICGYTTVCKNRTRTASTVALGGCIMLPVSPSNKIYVQRSSNWAGNLVSLYAIGYRKIGYNE